MSHRPIFHDSTFVRVTHSSSNHFDAGSREKGNDGSLPLHLAFANKAPVEVVAAVLAAHPDGEAA